MAKKNRSKLSKENIRYVGLGFEILAVMLLFVGGGYALDQWQETSKPWFTLALSLLGSAFVIYLIIRTTYKKS